jgi:sporulation related protein
MRTLLAMAEHVAHPPRSERFIKTYLFVWGLLAAGGLTYLATLVWQPDWLSPPSRPTQIAEPEPDSALRLASRAIAEVRDVRRSVGDVQRSLGEIRETLDRSVSEEKLVNTRLTALEGRVIDMAQPTPVPVATAPAPPAGKQKAAVPPVKGTVANKAAEKPADPVAAATRIMSAVMSVPDQTEKPAPEAAAPNIETGSIGPAAITFGEPVVTRSHTGFAVQLGAGRSVEALKLSWSLLLDQHGEALSPLQPRVIAPRTDGGSYRLVAGPFESRPEAEKICAAMALSRNKCFSTVFTGEPL